MNTKLKFAGGLLALAAVTGVGLEVGKAAGFLTNGLPVAGGAQYPSTIPLTGAETLPADTNLPNGQNPASEAITILQTKLFAATPLVLTDVLNTAASGLPQTAPVIDASLADVYTITLSVASTSLGTPINLVPGKTFRIFVKQDGTGTRRLTAPTGGLWTFNGGQISPLGISTAANAVDSIAATYDGTKLRATTADNFQ